MLMENRLSEREFRTFDDYCEKNNILGIGRVVLMIIQEKFAHSIDPNCDFFGFRTFEFLRLMAHYFTNSSTRHLSTFLRFHSSQWTVSQVLREPLYRSFFLSEWGVLWPQL